MPLLALLSSLRLFLLLLLMFGLWDSEFLRRLVPVLVMGSGISSAPEELVTVL